MTGTRAVAIVIGMTVSFAVLGVGVGYGLGRLAPGYYRSVFPSGNEASFDPIAVGLGQGLTQGTVGGAVVGLITVALLCLRELRCRADAPDPANSDRAVRIWARILYAIIGLLALAFCCSASFLIGAVIGSVGAYQRHAMKDRDIATRALEDDPAFASVMIEEVSNGDVYLSGTVSTPEDLERLRRLIGEAWASEVVSVRVGE